MIPAFNFASIPKIIFGAKKFNDIYDIILSFGKKALIITGAKSLRSSGRLNDIFETLEKKGVTYFHKSLTGEPSPGFVDSCVSEYRTENLDVVVGIGGGSVTDVGKAISAMLLYKDSVKNYLEGVGTKTHDGRKVPYIAIPTTSGTGSETTKNAVISEVGPNGFKKSLRHDNLIPNIAIIDPKLVIGCPSSITGACGMDAFTQLLESYVSSKANPITDALAFSGMKYMKDVMIDVCGSKANDIDARMVMAYGSLLSGITLANAGLGIIHGLASPIGGFFSIPHGIVCGTLLSEATKKNIEILKPLGKDGALALKKYGEIGALLSGNLCFEPEKADYYCDLLIETLERWTKELKIDKLGRYGINENDVDKIVDNVGLKNNPIQLSKEDIKEIVVNRI